MTPLIVTALFLPAPVPTAPTLCVTDALTTRAVRTWSIELPADPFHRVSGSIPIPHDNGAGFTLTASGNGFEIDTDGDGQSDRTVEGREHPETKVRQARLTLTGERDGVAFSYPVRLEFRGDGWAWASSSVMQGMIGKTAVQLIDVDGNGVFTDVGRDAITVGGSDIAQFLGETLVVDGDLHSVAFDATDDGLTVLSNAFEGEVGTLDLRSEFGGKGVMLGAVVQSVDRKHSFELAYAKSGAKVPVGRYRLVSAKLGLGEARATVNPGMMRSMKVKAGETTALRWGSPIKASFTYSNDGSEVMLDPEKVRYVGAAGERWIGWNPVGKSPTFHVKDANTGKVLIDAVFPGSC